MRLIYALTLSLTSIQCLERLFHDEALLGLISEMALKKPQQKGLFERMFADTSLKKSSIAASEAVLTLWTDLTMVY